MRILKYYNDALRANIDRETLEAEGIRSAVFNELAGVVIPLSGAIPSLRPHLVVADEDYAAAAAILGIRPVVQPEPLKCPHCGSPRVKYGFGGGTPLRRFLAKYIFFPFAALTGISPHRIHGNYRCSECRREFEPAAAMEAPAPMRSRRLERLERSVRLERPMRAERLKLAERPEVSGLPEPSEQPEKPWWPEPPRQPEKPSRPEQPEQPETPDSDTPAALDS